MHVDINGWLSDVSADLDQSTFTGLMSGLQGLHNGLLFTVTSRYPLGTNVFDRDWDLLLLLDACRVDAMREVAPEYEFIESVDSIWSVGSSSHEFICHTYRNEYLDEIRDTKLISTNPNVPRVFEQGTTPPGSYSVPLMWADWDLVDKDDFGLLWQIHKHDYEEYFSPPPPGFVTDHVIRSGREFDYDRTIVHYFQPHIPYMQGPYAESRKPNEKEAHPWTAIRSGRATKDEIWKLYLDNLRFVLDSIERLLENYDAEKVVISADHGDLMGELGAYGHPEGFPHPNLKKVPWVETSAVDERTSTPTVDIERQRTEIDVDQQLRDLGYL